MGQVTTGASGTREDVRHEGPAAAWHARLSEALASTSDSRAALAAVCREIGTLAACDRVQIWRGDIRQLTMHAVIAVGYDPIDAARLLELRIPMSGMPLAPDFLDRKYLPISYADDLPDYAVGLFRDFGIRAAAHVLLERGDRILGALQLSWCGSPTPRFPDRDLIEVARTYAALALDFHARTEEALQTATTLSDTAMLLASIHDPDRLLETLARKITEAVGCDWGAVHLVDEETGHVHLVAGAGLQQALEEVGRIDSTVSRLAELFDRADDDVIEVSDVHALQPLVDRGLGAHLSSLLALPLRRAERIVGVLTIGYSERTGRFARRQVALAKGLVHHAVAALETARLIRSLEDANRAKSDFVAAVSHDLRTPLHILIGYADMLLEGAAGDLNAEQAELVERVRDRSLRFRDLVDGILAVARLDAQTGGARLTTIHLDELCADLARELDDRRNPGPALRWHAAHEAVEVDAAKVRMILRNLVANALKFTGAGSVEFEAVAEKSALRLTVRDSGPGIAAGERAQIFEMFHQGDAGRRLGGSGLGLGLYLVRRLARGLGGDVALLTAEPGNTTFEATVPLAASPPAAP